MVYPIGKMGRWIATYPVKELNGLENIPEDMPFIFACNHTSFMDPLILGVITKYKKLRKIYFISAMYLFFDLLSNFVFMEWGGSIRIKKGKSFLDSAVKKLNKGNIVGIFPEGFPNKQPNLRKGKTGVSRLILKGKVPVIPVGIQGSLYIWSRLKWIPRPKKKVIINIGKPMYFSDNYGKDDDYSVLRKMTDQIMIEIAKLTSQEYKF